MKGRGGGWGEEMKRGRGEMGEDKEGGGVEKGREGWKKEDGEGIEEGGRGGEGNRRGREGGRKGGSEGKREGGMKTIEKEREKAIEEK